MSETPAAAPRLSSRKLVRSLGAALLLALILPSVDRGPLANALVDVSTPQIDVPGNWSPIWAVGERTR